MCRWRGTMATARESVNTSARTRASRSRSPLHRSPADVDDSHAEEAGEADPGTGRVFWRSITAMARRWYATRGDSPRGGGMRVRDKLRGILQSQLRGRSLLAGDSQHANGLS